ncbi:uncharacterized protein PHALS_14655 [Plasmopara halstedii]|uniref:Uncharacterized protein n=1 Tax=Plasmopara halstedii TaxID=4781 RepID=A0A0P1APJ9_PLAHL|nr:uncharacterized protein PHALS_14655 [Plasmopara halstedii]CEG42785.1 hypothetical protein PHALS_14655 [Plasmopara halstedii]|eukprot:XP_024579154.1 hypothetical protein PHALS_14655 [Plasmopara halstedii]
MSPNSLTTSSNGMRNDDNCFLWVFAARMTPHDSGSLLHHLEMKPGYALEHATEESFHTSARGERTESFSAAITHGRSLVYLLDCYLLLKINC